MMKFIMKRFKEPKLLVWQYTGLKIIGNLFAMLALMFVGCWSVLLGLACGISLVNDGETGMTIDHLTQAKSISFLEDFLRQGIGWLIGLVVLTLMTELARKIVMNSMRNSLTQETTLTRLIISTGQSVELPLLKVNSTWRRQTLAYKKVKRAPIGKRVLASKLDRQTRKKQQQTWRDQQKQERQERQQRLAKLASNEVMVAPITIATWFGTLNLLPNDIRIGNVRVSPLVIKGK